MHSSDSASIAEEQKRHRVRLARLEADLAYFQARLEIIGEPGSANQMAQRKVFKLLHKNVGGKILKAKRQVSDIL